MIVRRVLHPLLVLALTVAAPRAALAWQTAVPGTPGASRPFTVAVDADGDVVAAGRAVVAAGDDDAVIAKLSGRDGALRWQHTFAGSAAASDVLRSVATDSTRGVVTGGLLVNTGTGGDLLVARYDAEGTLAWRVEIDGGASAQDDALAVAVDAAGSPLVAGSLTPAGAAATRFAILKLALADGATVWRTVFPEEPGSARALVVDGDDVIAAGDAGGRVVVTRLASATGTPVWRANLSGSASGAHVGRAVAVGNGRVVVAGRLAADFAVVALDAGTGAEAWRYVIDGTATMGADGDDVFAVALDATGDVLAAGRLSNTDTGDDALVVKLAGASGAELWRTTINGGSGNDDVAQAIALDAAGDVLLTGTLRNRGTRADVLLAKLAGATGAEVWRHSLNGSENGPDSGFAAARTAEGDIVAAGRIRNGTAADSFVVVKRTGANGGDFPCGDGTTDPGEGCDDGNVTPGDGCRADCTKEVCGDAILDPQEECDDGGATDSCCSPTCTTAADDTPCDDRDACSLGDRCQRGLCVATSARVCEPTDPCDLTECDPADGTCSHVRRSEGALCDDGDVCTVLAQCIGNTCSGRTTRFCGDGDPCTADSCVPTVGCTFDPVTGSASLTCAFDRPTIASGCPGGLPAAIHSPLDRARKLAGVAAATDRTPKMRRAVGGARRALKRAARATDVRRRHELLDPDCATALTEALADILARADALRASLTR